jgi:hypothetical protein
MPGVRPLKIPNRRPKKTDEMRIISTILLESSRCLNIKKFLLSPESWPDPRRGRAAGVVKTLKYS